MIIYLNRFITLKFGIFKLTLPLSFDRKKCRCSPFGVFLENWLFRFQREIKNKKIKLRFVILLVFMTKMLFFFVLSDIHPYFRKLTFLCRTAVFCLY